MKDFSQAQNKDVKEIRADNEALDLKDFFWFFFPIPLGHIFLPYK